MSALPFIIGAVFGKRVTRAMLDSAPVKLLAGQIMRTLAVRKQLDEDHATFIKVRQAVQAAQARNPRSISQATRDGLGQVAGALGRAEGEYRKIQAILMQAAALARKAGMVSQADLKEAGLAALPVLAILAVIAAFIIVGGSVAAFTIHSANLAREARAVREAPYIAAAWNEVNAGRAPGSLAAGNAEPNGVLAQAASAFSSLTLLVLAGAAVYFLGPMLTRKRSAA